MDMSDIARKLGIMVFCGVPAIIGGGILFDVSGGSYAPVILYEAALIAFAGALATR